MGFCVSSDFEVILFLTLLHGEKHSLPVQADVSNLPGAKVLPQTLEHALCIYWVIHMLQDFVSIW